MILYLLKDSITEETKHHIFGNLLIFILIGMIFVNVTYGVVVGCLEGYKKLKECREKNT